ncbi:MAG TPA: ECF transporter S component [Firmicutes bacterium]|nr:ECF transporter S component [Bacillota bacterium]
MHSEERISVQQLTRLALLLALTLSVQSLRLPTPVTGPLVNLMLILSTAVIGTAGGVSIGLFTPWAALLLGIIPPPLAPAIPFIMLGNGLYCFSYGSLAGKAKGGPWIGIALGSALKFVVIAGAARHFLTLPPPAAGALLLPQLINALLGGIAALAPARYLRRLLR